MQGTSPTALLCACSETRAGQACTARERSPEGALHGGTQERKICLTSSEPEEWLWPCWDPAEGPRLDLLGARLMGAVDAAGHRHPRQAHRLLPLVLHQQALILILPCHAQAF